MQYDKNRKEVTPNQKTPCYGWGKLIYKEDLLTKFGVLFGN
jgi:hypothetical protein